MNLTLLCNTNNSVKITANITNLSISTIRFNISNRRKLNFSGKEINAYSKEKFKKCSALVRLKITVLEDWTINNPSVSRKCSVSLRVRSMKIIPQNSRMTNCMCLC